MSATRPLIPGDETMKRRILLGIFVGALVGLVVGTILFQSTGRTCEEWQREYARVVEEGRGGAFTFINQGPTADRLRELEAERPDDCPTP